MNTLPQSTGKILKQVAKMETSKTIPVAMQYGLLLKIRRYYFQALLPSYLLEMYYKEKYLGELDIWQQGNNFTVWHREIEDEYKGKGLGSYLLQSAETYISGIEDIKNPSIQFITQKICEINWLVFNGYSSDIPIPTLPKNHVKPTAVTPDRFTMSKTLSIH